MNKTIRVFSTFLILIFLFSSCSSTTMIQSNPSKAKIYLDGAYIGETPYLYEDTKIVGSSMVIKLEKEGYKPLVSTITRDEQVDVGAIVGGMFFVFPFLWTMKYEPFHNYELRPMEEAPVIETQKNQAIHRSKAERLRELKLLLDDQIVTQEEFEKEKKKILDEVE
jgi:hypothetical protein